MPRKVDNGALFIWCAPGRKVSSLHPITRDSTNVVKLINKASLLNVWCWQIFLLKSVHHSIVGRSLCNDWFSYFLFWFLPWAGAWAWDAVRNDLGKRKAQNIVFKAWILIMFDIGWWWWRPLAGAQRWGWCIGVVYMLSVTRWPVNNNDGPFQ